MIVKYGNYSSTQLETVKTNLRKNIFFLLLYVDPNTKGDYLNIDVE